MKKGNYKTFRSGVVHSFTGKKDFMPYDVYDCGLVAYIRTAPLMPTYFNGKDADQLVDEKVTCKKCLKAMKG